MFGHKKGILHVTTLMNFVTHQYIFVTFYWDFYTLEFEFVVLLIK